MIWLCFISTNTVVRLTALVSYRDNKNMFLLRSILCHPFGVYPMFCIFYYNHDIPSGLEKK
ncbi:MAG: hypothetical protein ACUBOA_02060, partial [Candidatus Loosdrechtia sp.]|uniref:hypothetical protein n=1 Tax=Candidatus Loosdrechtia sp. TaxID=3101272 RepID=UPI00403AC180